MNKQDVKGCVAAVREYLVGVGFDISNVQATEVVARAIGFKNKHTLAAATKNETTAKSIMGSDSVPDVFTVDGKAYRVFPCGHSPMTVAQMDALDFHISGIIPVPLNLMEDMDESEENSIDDFNNYVSKALTGSDYALQDITLTHVPQIIYGKGYVAYLVTGSIGEPEEHFEQLADRSEQVFYQNLSLLAKQFQLRREISFTAPMPTGCVTGRILRVNFQAISLLQKYATLHGQNNDEINAARTVIAATLSVNNAGLTEEIHIPLEALKYATRLSETKWSLPLNDNVAWLNF